MSTGQAKRAIRGRKRPTRRRRRAPLAALVSVILAGVGLLVAGSAVPGPWPWHGRPTTITSDAAPAPSAPAPVPDGSARELLDTVEVSDHADVPGYDADRFGWRKDTDRNGCDTRNDVLRRDLTELRIKPGTRGCVVSAGVLVSPYSGEPMQFVAGSKSGVDIDHVIARENAWQSGASSWSSEELEQFGNDPMNLLAVESSLNRSHGSRAADAWLPDTPEGACAYGSRQVAVKARYGLTMTTAEHAALGSLLDGCAGGGTLPGESPWPAPED